VHALDIYQRAASLGAGWMGPPGVGGCAHAESDLAAPEFSDTDTETCTPLFELKESPPALDALNAEELTGELLDEVDPVAVPVAAVADEGGLTSPKMWNFALKKCLKRRTSP